MPVDSSIYLNLRSPDIGAAMEQGAKLKELGMKRDAAKAEAQKKANIQSVYKSSMGADGKIDQGKLVMGLGQLGYGEEALTHDRAFKDDTYKAQGEERSQGTYKSQQKTAQLNQAKDEAELIGQTFNGVSDQSSYTAALQALKGKVEGIDQNLPAYYDPGVVKSMVSRAVSIKDQWNKENSDREFQMSKDKFNRDGQQFDKTFGLQNKQFDYSKKQGDRNFGLEVDKFGYSKERDKEDFSIKRAESQRKAQGGENLPLDQKEKVQVLSKGVANTTQIKNMIGSSLTQLRNPDISDDQKVVIGQEMLKSLNSTLGPDALAAFDMKRLAGFLEFKKGNFTEPGSFIGRDIDMFTEQVENNISRLDETAKSNQAEIDSLMGRPQAAKPPHGPSVTQNGVTYNWNPATGQYE